MGQRSPLFTFALCISLTVHLLGLSALAWWYVAHTPPPRYSAIDRERIMIDAMNRPRQNPRTPPPPTKQKKRSPPPSFQQQPPAAPKDDSGEVDGKGAANRSTPAEHPMEASQGYEQADLMRNLPDPLDLDPNSPLPAAAGARSGSNANKQSIPQPGKYTPDFVAESRALADPNADTAKPLALQKGVGPLPLPVADKANVPAPSGAKTPVLLAAANASQTESPQAIRGHRAVSGDTESVPFAKANSVTLHDGRADGRQGLKVSTRIPRFGLASEHDLEVMGGFRLVIGAWVDADGNVTDATILQSSGSTNIDLDYQNSIYNWTFEPPKDKAGHPQAAQWSITCD